MITSAKNLKYIINLTSLALALPILLLSGCASLKVGLKTSRNISPKSTERLIVKPKPLLSDERQKLASVAKTFIGKSALKVGPHTFRSDCSGAIRAIFATARLRLGGIIKRAGDNDVKTIYRYVQKYGKVIKNSAEPGDLVFFHNTYDRSRNGRMNDALTHIGLIEKIEGDTIYFVHHLGQSVIRSRMNLAHPTQTYDPHNHTRINHILRRAQGKHRAYTAAELFAGFGRL